jgi:2,4-dienoyl-CoA reductase-like NADH-dependent reductase (Old Yellow Enzyme family)
MEGFDAHADGSPGELTLRRYKRYAAGGFGLIWFEATAVIEEARSNPAQLWLHAGNAGAFGELVQATRRTVRERFGHDVLLVIQLTHSGRHSKPAGQSRPIIAYRDPVLDCRHDLPDEYPVVTDDYLDRLQDAFVEAARLAAEAGFDGVDIKSCHRYLVSELLASFTRRGRYGGSFENRTRLLRESLARIKAEVPSVFITTRMNAYDAIAHPYGFGVDKEDHTIPDLTEPIELARELAGMGLPVLNVSIGNPYSHAHFGRPYDRPLKGSAVPDEHPLVGVERLIGIVRQVQESVPGLPVVGTGYSWLRHLMPHVAAGVINSGGAAVLGIGRGAFAYPDTPRDVMENGRMDPAKCCVTCSACTQIMRQGGMTGCVVRDGEIYGPQYRQPATQGA